MDLNFERCLNTTFGHNYTSVPMSKRGPGSRFRTSFESVKRNFSGLENKRIFEIGPIDMDVSDSIHYDDDEGAVRLSRYKWFP